MNKARTKRHMPTPEKKWSKERLLQTARERTKELTADNARQVREMLSNLLDEAQWTEAEFLDAMCQDYIDRGAR